MDIKDVMRGTSDMGDGTFVRVRHVSAESRNNVLGDVRVGWVPAMERTQGEVGMVIGGLATAHVSVVAFDFPDAMHAFQFHDVHLEHVHTDEVPHERALALARVAATVMRRSEEAASPPGMELMTLALKMLTESHTALEKRVAALERRGVKRAAPPATPAAAQPLGNFVD